MASRSRSPPRGEGDRRDFTIFMSIGGVAGGAANKGKVERGRFYVGNHGKHTEVSQEFFEYSRIHGYSIWATHPAAMGSMVLLGLRKIKEEKRRERLSRRLNAVGRASML